MLKEDNELLTRIGPNARMGQLLRRYWWPVATSDKAGSKPVPTRALGEDLILFRDGTGKVGLVERSCPHRSASLEFGRVEKDGIRCFYHGWKFGTDGGCLDMPAEPENSPLKKQVKIRSYPTQEMAGLIFAYMGPAPVPLLPAYDLLVRDDMDRVVTQGLDRCNWLQRAENAADPCHSMALHASVYPSIALKRPDALYEKTWYGMRFSVQYEGQKLQNVFHQIVPSHTRRFGARVGDKRPAQYLHLRTPIDDYQTITYIIEAVETEGGRPGTLAIEDLRVMPPGEYDRVEDGWWGIASHDQDRAAQESQGVIADRTKETLGTSDRGIAMLRQMLLDGLKAIDAGEDPMGIIRDTGENNLIAFDAKKNFTDMDKDFSGKAVG
jgi:5,5'-dehydrodivanillate O-demethylase